MKNGAFFSTGLLAAMASSLCCIAPLLALTGGLSGGVSAFAWVEPLRPYLIGLSVLALGIAFYLAYRPSKTDECDCELKDKRSFLNSKGFLWAVTVISVLLFSFPYYVGAFYSGEAVTSESATSENLVEMKVAVDGMTCNACENHVNKALLAAPGVTEASSSYSGGWAKVKFDSSRTDASELAGRIEQATGYKVGQMEKIR